MDQPTTSHQETSRPRRSQPISVMDKDFSDRVHRMLYDDSDMSSDSSEVVDDSDVDPDYVLPTEAQEEEYSGTEGTNAEDIGSYEALSGDEQSQLEVEPPDILVEAPTLPTESFHFILNSAFTK